MFGRWLAVGFTLSALCATAVHGVTEILICKEPHKTTGRNLVLNWTDQKVSFGDGPFRPASYWSKEAIHWQDWSQTEHQGRGKPVSFQFSIQLKSLMYTVLDSDIVSPKSNEDWAAFLPVYLSCTFYY